MTGPVDPEDDATAAEYALRLLDADEHRAFERRLSDEPSLVEAVHRWERHLSALADDLPAVTPPRHIKAKVLDSINPTQPARASKTGWWWWGGLALAAILAVAFLTPLLRGPADLSPSFGTELASADGALVITAGVIPATHEIVLERVVGAPPEGRVHELWLIPEGATAPISLGVLDGDGSTRIRVPDEIAPGVRTGTVAISDEPPGGSPTGAPTGAILATGTFVDL